MRFKTVDGLRGIAAMSVVLFHLNAAAGRIFGDWLPPAVEWAFGKGYLGVDVFFVLSGFVIAYSVRNGDLTGGFIGRFALRRSIRLDPPYWAAIFLEIGVQWLALRLAFSSAPLPSLPQFLAHFLYLQNLLGLGDIIELFWTLCFEIQFYLALISMLVLRRKLGGWLGGRGAEWLSTVALTSLFVYSICIRYEVMGLTGHHGVATVRWFQFFMGTCVWWVVSDRISWLALPASWLTLMVVVLSTGADWLQLLPIAVSGLLWWSYRRDKMATILSGRTVQFLGLISYSLYVFHTTLGWRLIQLSGTYMDESSPAAMMLLVFVSTLAVCVFSSWVGWRLLEGPSIRFAKRIQLPQRTSKSPEGAV